MMPCLYKLFSTMYRLIHMTCSVYPVQNTMYLPQSAPRTQSFLWGSIPNHLCALGGLCGEYFPLTGLGISLPSLLSASVTYYSAGPP